MCKGLFTRHEIIGSLTKYLHLYALSFLLFATSMAPVSSARGINQWHTIIKLQSRVSTQQVSPLMLRGCIIVWQRFSNLILLYHQVKNRKRENIKKKKNMVDVEQLIRERWVSIHSKFEFFEFFACHLAIPGLQLVVGVTPVENGQYMMNKPTEMISLKLLPNSRKMRLNRMNN